MPAVLDVATRRDIGLGTVKTELSIFLSHLKARRAEDSVPQVRRRMRGKSPSSLSPVQGLPFDNGPNQRIDIGFPDSG
jgi:hypothetical protein